MSRGGLIVLFLALAGGVAFFSLGIETGSRGRDVAGPPDVARPAPAAVDPAPLVGGRRETREPTRPAPSARTEAGVPSEGSEGGNPALSRQQHVSGKVVEARGEIPGARLVLLEGRAPLGESRTDDRGQFSLRLERATGPLVLRVSAEGFAPLERELPPVQEGEGRLLGSLLLQPAVRVTGVVYAPAGAGDGVAPLAGARLTLRTRGMGVALNQHVHEAETGPDGRFEFPDAPLGRVEILARAEGHGEAYEELTVDPDLEPIEITLLHEKELLLRVVDPHGAPLEGIEITIHASGKPSAEHLAATDTEGRCRFPGLGEPLWEARVADDRVRPAARGELAANGEEHRIEVNPWPCATGSVLVPGGAPLPAGGVVRLVPASMNGDTVRLAGAVPHPLKQDGTFEICGVRPGQLLARIEVPGYAPSHSQVVRVQLEDRVDFGVVLLQIGGDLELRLSGPKGSVGGAQVDLFLSPPQRSLIWMADPGTLANLVATARSDAEGRVRIEHLMPGDHWMIVRSARHVPLLEGPIPVPSGRTRDLGAVPLEQGGFLRGRVIDETGRGVLGAFVMLIQESTDPINVQVTTDATGRYASPPLPAGKWLIRARALGGRGTRPSETIQTMIQAGETSQLDLSI